MNYFELFEIPESPIVDQEIVSKKYITLQRKYHPDFFQDATESEKEEVLNQSAEINKAYKIFKNDQSTIEYFLTIKGQIQEEEKYSLPADFLMEMMELNEDLMGEEPNSVKVKLQALESFIYQPIENVMKNLPMEWSEQDLQKVKEYYYKKKYLERILDRLED